MQIIYDSKGKIFQQGSGFPKPEGTLTYMEVEVPENHYVKGLDITKDPVEVIFGEYPKTEMQKMQEIIDQQQSDLDFLMLLSDNNE